MPLSDEQLERYSRQIIVPGIGEQGQQRLLASRVLVVGAARGVAQACLYLRAAGVTVVQDYAADDAGSPPPSAIVIAGADTLCEDRRRDLLDAGVPICWYVLGTAGFTSGCHPLAQLPAVSSRSGTAEETDESIHDAAACDAAAAACALLVGLTGPAGPFECNVA